MNFKTTLALLILLIGIGAFLFIQRDHDGAANKGATPTEAAKLLDLKTDDVTKVAVLPADGKPLILEKSGLNWKIVEPIQAPAETTEVDGLLRDISDLSSHSELDRSQEKSAGLDKPPYKIELTTKDKTIKLSVGDKPALGDDLPVLVEGKDKPQIVSASIISRLQKPISAYRKTRLLDVANEAIKQLQITRGSQTVRLARTAAGWQITEPKSMPADTSLVDSMLFAISGLNSTGFDDSISLEDAGLSKPRIVVSFSTEAPSTQPSTPSTQPGQLPGATTIAFGGYEDVTRKDVYATVSSGSLGAGAPSAGIAKIAATTLDSFRKTALDLRDKKVADIDPDRVESFSVEIDHPATTQPTTAPARRTYTIARRKEETTLGPILPTTAPATLPATQLSATTTPTSGPATFPGLATSQPTAPLIASSKWTFTEGNTGDAEETQVDPLLSALHPLKAEKFLNPASTTSAASAPTTTATPSTYNLTLHVGPGAGAPAADYTLHITDAGGIAKPVGEFNDLRFELDRALLKDLDGDFKTKVAAPAPAAPSFPGAGRLPPGHPSFLPQGGEQ